MMMIMMIFGTVCTKLMCNFGEEICDIRLRCGHFLQRKYKIISEGISIGQPTKTKRFLSPTNHYGDGLSCVSLESEGVSIEWTDGKSYDCLYAEVKVAKHTW